MARRVYTTEPETIEDDDSAQTMERAPRKASIPFEQGEAEVYAQMVKAISQDTVGVQQDDHGQWAVVVETTVTKVKRLTTLNAVMKYAQRARQQAMEPVEAETPIEG